ncbi:MAG: dynamin [Alphaproteobacteria bacterium]|jgi:hypothetical protein|nr:dynamin [Alphaproteobacteria bacterium]
MASSDLRTPSRGLYLVLGVVAVLVIAVGMLFMSGTVEVRNDTARAPTDPAARALPADEPRTPAIPMRPAPAPANPADTTPAPDRPAQQ